MDSIPWEKANHRLGKTTDAMEKPCGWMGGMGMDGKHGNG